MRGGQSIAWVVAAAFGLGVSGPAGAAEAGESGGLELEPLMSVSGEPGLEEQGRESPASELISFNAAGEPLFRDAGRERRNPRDMPARWGPERGDFEVTLSGAASNDGRFRQGQFGVDGSFGYYLTRDLLIDLRQNVAFEDFGDPNWSGATRVALDWHFDFDRLRPFVGIVGGGFYGERIRDTAAFGLEGGVKYYVKPDTFLYGRVEHHWFTRSATDEIEFGNRRLLYTIGIGFNF